MIFTVVNDCHYGSKYQDIKDIDKKMLALPASPTTLFIGDNVDLACCKKKDLPRLREFEARLRYKHEESYDFGNHERMSPNYKILIRTTNNGTRVLFCHGDLERNGTKWREYRQKPQGAAWYKLPWIAFLDGLDFAKAMRPLESEYLENLAQTAKDYNCTHIVIGHIHPLKQVHKLINDVTIHIMPPGINEIYIN